MNPAAAGRPRIALRLAVPLAVGLLLCLVAFRYSHGSDSARVLATLATFLFLLLACSILAWGLPSRWEAFRWGADKTVSVAEERLTDGRATVLLAGGMALYAAVWSLASLLRHAGLNSCGFDLAIQHQVVWNLAHGRGFASSIETANYLGDHVALTLPLFAPLLWIWNGPGILLIAQSVVLALGAWPVYRLASRRCGTRTEGLVWSLVYLCLPAIGFMNKYDFHDLVAALPILLAAIDAVDDRRWWAASVWMLLALGTREEVGLAVAAIGVWAAVARDRRLWGIGWGLLGFGWAIFALYVVIPHFRGGSPSDTLARYAWLGTGPGEVLRTLLTHPWTLFATHYHRVRRVLYPIQLLWPFAGFPLLSLGHLLLALPNLALSLTSSAISQNSIYFQYNAPIFPFFFWAGIEGFRRRGAGAGRRGVACAALLLSLVAANAADPALWKGVAAPYTVVDGVRPRSNRAAFREAAALIPEDADLLASNDLAPHFSAREKLGVIQTRKPNARASVVICDLTDTRHLNSPVEVARLVSSWIEEEGYRTVFFREGILVLRLDGYEDPTAASSLRAELARVLSVTR
jgi:uncharacterized membrane protein